jgi:hypothetical protein
MKTNHHRDGRALHVLDIEYLSGGPSNHQPDAVRWTLDRFEDTAQRREGDHAIGAASHWFYARTLFECGDHMRYLPAGGGPDAADRRLLAEVDPTWVASHYDRVVLGSGDHIFEDLVIDLRGSKVRTWVVGYRHNMSHRLVQAADEVHFLDDHTLAA